MSELVSVIIPAYNCSLTIKRCIDSIINQTYNEIEILIINDGSTDNTLKILKEYEKKDNRIKIFDIINKGVSNARNVGIKNSIGKYIIFIDSDDYVANNYIEMLVKCRRENNTLTACNYKVFKNENEFFSGRELNVENKMYKIEENFYELLIDFNVLKAPWGKIYDLNIIRENDIFFDTDISLGEDLIFNLKYIRFIQNIYYINEKLYYYSRENMSSLSCKYYSNMIYIQNKIKNNIIGYMEETKYSNKRKIYLVCLRMLMSSVSNEFHKKESFIKKYLDAKKVFKSQEIQEYVEFLYQNNIIDRIKYFILKNKMIFGYLLIKNKF